MAPPNRPVVVPLLSLSLSRTPPPRRRLRLRTPTPCHRASTTRRALHTPPHQRTRLPPLSVAPSASPLLNPSIHVAAAPSLGRSLRFPPPHRSRSLSNRRRHSSHLFAAPRHASTAGAPIATLRYSAVLGIEAAVLVGTARDSTSSPIPPSSTGAPSLARCNYINANKCKLQTMTKEIWMQACHKLISSLWNLQKFQALVVLAGLTRRPCFFWKL
ncbi:hypothetical protein DAI22_09g010100 [Oryza sativa Japonica Group]|nr:uncharacterized protein LOC4346433 [Oryza sativa Japonica Group]KAF2915152.1 hypothetical protein DAI22_09g010100 [Oryza sativa Japonica Group]